MVEPTDEELVAAVAAGPGALPEFYRRHVAKVIGMGVRRFAEPEDVADFVADVFVEVLACAGGFDPRRGGAVPWLYGVAGNIAAARLRRQYREGTLPGRLAGRTLLDSDDYARVEERIDAAADLRATYGAIATLPDPDRRVLTLVAIDGLAPADAAAALGISPLAVRVRLSRARSKLRRALAARAGADVRPVAPASSPTISS